MSKKFSMLLAVLTIVTMVLSACSPAATTEAPAAPAPTEAPTKHVVNVTIVPTRTAEPTKPAEPTKAPEATATTAAAAPAAVDGKGKKVCQVTDTGGIDDKSFNATAWRGVENAKKDFGVEGKFLESQQQTDYEKNINAFIEEKCDLIVTVGFLLGDATAAAAKANPEQKFGIVDFAYDPALPNVTGMVFATEQAGFLAGYAAAAVTKTGKVGTFGGIQIPPVTSFMDGYYYGVQYHNEKKGTNVEVLGWDPAAQTGLFTGNFESTDDGSKMGQTLMDEGADVIMPVAGPVGLGTAEAVKTRGNAWIVGVDDDWAVKNEQYKDIILTSVMKNMDISVYELTQAVLDGSFEGGLMVGTLENGGVGLGTSASVITSAIQAELDSVKADLISGKVSATGKK